MTLPTPPANPASEVGRISTALNAREKAALLYLPPKDWTPGAAYWVHSNTLKALSKRERWLVRSRPHPTRAQTSQWRLTSLGIAVRAHLLSPARKEESDV